jgi:hypothetical protein
MKSLLEQAERMTGLMIRLAVLARRSQLWLLVIEPNVYGTCKPQPS